MRVLVLACGGTRLRASVEDAAQVINDGGSATLVIDKAGTYGGASLPPGLQVVELARLQRRHPPHLAEQLVLFRAPRWVLRTLGRGPLTAWAGRASAAYQHRIADRIHRRLFLPVYRRVWGDVPSRLLQRQIRRIGTFDAIVISDPASMPVAARLVKTYVADGKAPPSLSYTVDDVRADYTSERLP